MNNNNFYMADKKNIIRCTTFSSLNPYIEVPNKGGCDGGLLENIVYQKLIKNQELPDGNIVTQIPVGPTRYSGTQGEQGIQGTQGPTGEKGMAGSTINCFSYKINTIPTTTTFIMYISSDNGFATDAVHSNLYISSVTSDNKDLGNIYFNNVNIGSKITVQTTCNSDNYITYVLTSAVYNKFSVHHAEYGVEYVSSGGSFTNGEDIMLFLSFRGDIGPTGPTGTPSTVEGPTGPRGGIVGQISHFAFNLSATILPPPMFLICDGSEISRTDYANLFNAIGTTFGDGDGTNTFNIPDLRGMFIRSYDPRPCSVGNDPCDNIVGVSDLPDQSTTRGFGTTQSDALIDFSCTTVVNNGYVAQPWNENKGGITQTGGPVWTGGSVTFDSKNFNISGTSDPIKTSIETRPKNVALLGCIHY